MTPVLWSLDSKHQPAITLTNFFPEAGVEEKPDEDRR